MFETSRKKSENNKKSFLIFVKTRLSFFVRYKKIIKKKQLRLAVKIPLRKRVYVPKKRSFRHVNLNGIYRDNFFNVWKDSKGNNVL